MRASPAWVSHAMRRWPLRQRRTLAVALSAVAVLAPAAWLASAQPSSAVHPAATVTAVTTVAGGDRIVTMHLDGRTRAYRLHVPAGLPPGPHTLLVALHWLNGTAARMQARSRLDDDALVNNAVVAYPEGVGRSWDAGTCCGFATRHRLDDVDFLVQVVADVQRRVPIDPARVAVTGFSNGGLMSYRLVCQRPDIFHVAVVMAGDDVVRGCVPRHPVSLLHVHGSRDSVIPIEGVARSTLDHDGFPPAATSVERIAGADGCRAASSTSVRQLIWWRAQGCAGSARVQFVTVKGLGHRYPNGVAGLRTYGVDMTSLTWSFIASSWPH